MILPGRLGSSKKPSGYTGQRTLYLQGMAMITQAGYWKPG